MSHIKIYIHIIKYVFKSSYLSQSINQSEKSIICLCIECVSQESVNARLFKLQSTIHQLKFACSSGQSGRAI